MVGKDKSSVVAFLYQLRKQGVDIKCTDQKLKIVGTRECLTDELLSEVKKHKLQIINYMNSNPVQYYPMASNQGRMWTTYSLSNIKPSHNLYMAVELNEDIKLSRLEECCQRLIDDHEILRTGYTQLGNDSAMVIYPAKTVKYQEFNISTAEFDVWMKKQAEKHFILEEGDVIRFSVAVDQLTKNRLLLIVVHHIACDVDSLQLIFNLLEQCYCAVIERSEVHQYKQFVLRENYFYKTAAYETTLQYWNRQLDRDYMTISLKPEKQRQKLQQFTSTTKSLFDKCDTITCNSVITTAKNISVTPHNFLLAVFQLLIAKYAKQKKFHVGLPVSRKDISQSDMLGHFVDTYWARVDLQTKQTFLEFVQHVKTTSLDILANTGCGFFDILQKLHVDKSNNRFPIFQVVFNWVKYQALQHSSLIKQFYGSANTGFKSAPYEILLTVVNDGEQFILLWTYNTTLLNEDAMLSISYEYKKLIQLVTSDCSISISKMFEGVSK